MNTSITKIIKSYQKHQKPIAILLFFIILLLDQIIKHSIKNPIRNTGSLFGLFQNQTAAFIHLSFIAIGILLIFSDKINPTTLAILLSGILSNLIDRISYGYVIDYINLRIWPAFNLGDAAITLGVIFLFLQFIQSHTPCKV